LSGGCSSLIGKFGGGDSGFSRNLAGASSRGRKIGNVAKKRRFLRSEKRIGPNWAEGNAMLRGVNSLERYETLIDLSD